MLTNKAIEEVRKTRHKISAKYHHDTKELLEHYKQLESKYSDRIYGKKRLKKIRKLKPSKSLHRMLSAKGNPTMDNLTTIFKVLRQKLNVDIDVHTVPCH